MKEGRKAGQGKLSFGQGKACSFYITPVTARIEMEKKGAQGAGFSEEGRNL